MKLFIASVSAWALASASALTPTLASYYPPAKTSPSSTSFNRHTQTSEVSELLKMPQSHQTNYTRRVNTVQTSPLSHLSPDCDRTLCFALSSFSQAVSSRLVSSLLDRPADRHIDRRRHKVCRRFLFIWQASFLCHIRPCLVAYCTRFFSCEKTEIGIATRQQLVELPKTFTT